MGITIYSKNMSNDLSCGGFMRLRKTVANMCPEEISTHYSNLVNGFITLISNEDAVKKYDERTEELYLKYKSAYGKVIDFLYAPDTDCKFNYGVAKQLLKIIGDYDDDIIYGYAGWGEKAMKFKDFKSILEDAVSNKSKWGWR